MRLEPLERRTLCTITPAHLALSDRSVAETLPANNVYANGPYSVTWAGVNGQTTTSVSADCTTYITALLKQSYGYTSTQFTTWFGASSPSVTRYYNAAVADSGLDGFKDIASLKPGDLFISSYQDGSTSASGHMAIIDKAPTYVGVVNGYNAYNVTIVDVSSDLHTADTRVAIDPVTGAHDTGVGRGNIRLYTDAAGNLDHWAWGTNTTSTTYTATARPVTFAHVPAFTIGTPTKLTAIKTSDTGVALAWADNSGKEDGYSVERSGDGGTTWAVVGDTAANATAFTDSTLPAAAAYAYRVRAVGGSSLSPYSNVATVDTTPPPAMPTGGSLTVSGVKVALTWADGGGEAGYQVWRSTDGDAYALLATTAADATGYTDTVAPGHDYRYEMAAVGPGGTSALTDPMYVVVPPTNVKPIRPVRGPSASIALTARTRLVDLLKPR